MSDRFAEILHHCKTLGQDTQKQKKETATSKRGRRRKTRRGKYGRRSKGSKP